MTQPMPMPDTGDVLLTRGRSLMNKLTCKITGPAGHQATFYDSKTIVEANMTTGRVVKTGLDDAMLVYDEKGTEWIIYRPRQVNRRMMGAILRTKIQLDLDEAVEFEKYSALELPLQIIDTVINRWILRRPRQGYDAYIFRRLGRLWDNGIICSKTSNRALIKNGLIPISSGLEYGSPSDTYRYLKQSRHAIVLAFSKGWYDFNGA